MSIVSAALASLNLSPEDVSRKSKLSLERVRAIMDGSPARLSEVRALSSGLRVPKHFFSPGTLHGRRSDEMRVLFRSTPQARQDYDLTLERVSDYVGSVLTILPPRTLLPEWLSRFPPEPEEAYGPARQLAESFRKEFIGGDLSSPLLALPQIVAHLQGVVLAPLKESRFEGISLLRDGYFFIFISPRFAGRMLFTLAHELGHVIAHKARLVEPILEVSTSIGNFKKAKKSERFVDAFASCLLLPDQGVFQFLTVFREHRNIPLSSPVGDIEILLLARFFGVSFDVAAHRLEDLRILPEGGAFSMSEHLRVNHKSAEKRAEELGLPPRANLDFPRLSPVLKKELHLRIEAGDISIGWASDRFGVSVSELLEMHKPEARQ